MNADEQINQILAQRAKNLREINYQLITDDLTGLFNQRYFMIRLSEEINRAKRYQTSFCLILIDIDDFADINKELGMAAGDALLQEMANCLKNIIRSSDLLIRSGGDEFTIIAVQTGMAGGLDQANRVHSYLKNHLFLPNKIPITVSIGLSCYPQDGDTFEHLVSRAEMALFQAKIDGKNRISTASKGFESMDSKTEVKSKESVPLEQEVQVFKKTSVQTSFYQWVKVIPGYATNKKAPVSFWMNGRVHPIESLTKLEDPSAQLLYKAISQGNCYLLKNESSSWYCLLIESNPH